MVSSSWTKDIYEKSQNALADRKFLLLFAVVIGLQNLT